MRAGLHGQRAGSAIIAPVLGNVRRRGVDQDPGNYAMGTPAAAGRFQRRHAALLIPSGAAATGNWQAQPRLGLRPSLPPSLIPRASDNVCIKIVVNSSCSL